MIRQALDFDVQFFATFKEFGKDFKRIKYDDDYSDVKRFENVIRNSDVILPSNALLLPLKADKHLDYFVRVIARNYCVPFVYGFEKVKHDIKKQSTLPVHLRKRNLDGAYVFDKDLVNDDFVYVLFDDVVTTGSTFHAMRSALLELGVSRENIYFLSLLGGINERHIAKGLIHARF